MQIGEVSRRSGVSTRMLRHYDRIGLVSPSARSANGYRKYSESDIRRLFHVEALRWLGLSLQETARALDSEDFHPADIVERLVARNRDRLAQEQQLHDRLSRVRAADPSRWDDVLRTIALMRGLAADAPAERQRFALALGAEQRADAAAIAEAALTESDPNAAGALDWALARLGDDAVPVLATALHSPNRDRRRRAAAGLRKIGSSAASAALIAAIDSADPLVRGRAAIARARRGETAVIAELIALIADGVDDVEAAEELGALAVEAGRVEDAVALIARALADGGAPERQRLTAALAEFPDGARRALLIELENDPDRRVSVTATSLLS